LRREAILSMMPREMRLRRHSFIHRKQSGFILRL
jgi:hypothetical protein